MTNMVIHKDGSRQVTYNLVHIDQNSPLFLRMKGDWLYVRINFGPLLRPVGADFLMATDKAAFERLRPSYVLTHGSECEVYVSRVEGSVCRS